MMQSDSQVDLRRRAGGGTIVLSLAVLLHALVVAVRLKHHSLPISAKLVAECALGFVLSLVGVSVYVDNFSKLDGSDHTQQRWYLEKLRHRPDFAVFLHRGQALYAER
mmetsp:Transcript_13168/g.40511  ORF Transcript_13168/g.40511 Transcript_13168/m.40511 type:complete len:108 (+) Transcript_13168:162-485(+)